MVKKSHSDIKKDTTALYQHLNPRWPASRMPYYRNHVMSCSDIDRIIILCQFIGFLSQGIHTFTFYFIEIIRQYRNITDV